MDPMDISNVCREAERRATRVYSEFVVETIRAAVQQDKEINRLAEQAWAKHGKIKGKKRSLYVTDKTASMQSSRYTANEPRPISSHLDVPLLKVEREKSGKKPKLSPANIKTESDDESLSRQRGKSDRSQDLPKKRSHNGRWRFPSLPELEKLPPQIR